MWAGLEQLLFLLRQETSQCTDGSDPVRSGRGEHGDGCATEWARGGRARAQAGALKAAGMTSGRRRICGCRHWGSPSGCWHFPREAGNRGMGTEEGGPGGTWQRDLQGPPELWSRWTETGQCSWAPPARMGRGLTLVREGVGGGQDGRGGPQLLAARSRWDVGRVAKPGGHSWR